MIGHPPVSDARLLSGSIFVAVSIVGIGILGGQQGPEQMAGRAQDAMTASVGIATGTVATSTDMRE